MRRCVTSLIAVLLMATFVAARPQQPPTDRIIEEDLRLRPPLVPCAVPVYAALIARSARVPAGIEAVPESCDDVYRKSRANPPSDVFLQSLSVADAFDRLVQLDSRYAWTEENGVLVIRPVLASSDPSHFLNQTISLNLVDEPLTAALSAIQTALGPVRIPADPLKLRTPEGARRFSVNLKATSILAALNASVRSHGSMWWEVRYCQPAARYEYATIGFKTFDGSGLSSHVATRGDDGRFFDACRAGLGGNP